MSTKKNEKSSQVRIAVTDVTSAVTAALAANTPLSLTDIRGHEILVPAAKIGYIEIGEPVERRVGFGAL
jgi:hypothetical protein